MSSVRVSCMRVVCRDFFRLQDLYPYPGVVVVVSERACVCVSVMWKLGAEAPEAAIFYGSGSGKHEMNGSGSGSGSCKKILEAEAIKIYRFHRFHYSGF